MAAELLAVEVRNASNKHIACITLLYKPVVTTDAGICKAFLFCSPGILVWSLLISMPIRLISPTRSVFTIWVRGYSYRVLGAEAFWLGQNSLIILSFSRSVPEAVTHSCSLIDHKLIHWSTSQCFTRGVIKLLPKNKTKQNKRKKKGKIFWRC